MRFFNVIYNIGHARTGWLSNNNAPILPVFGPKAQVESTPQHSPYVPHSHKRKIHMRFTIPSRLVGTFTAAVIALTSFSAPAFADERRTQRTVAAILGLAVAGAIIHDQRKDKREERKTHRQPVRKQVIVKPGRRPAVVKRQHRSVQRPQVVVRNGRQVHRPRQIQPKPLPRRVHRN